ncbi:hypothetical protein OsI_35383 [Oryza sativa Indica Group]|uniref:GIL1/IRKI C-terminal domain-containing protein n=1 Tax=Oryza sativa subsp. indica TaxID=39946 RepID=A2ZC72_ORYSI|nr:hypothetical protein OsI_35383 [Oryza sativa Indica Group]
MARAPSSRRLLRGDMDADGDGDIALGAAAGERVVGFTVVPGFKVGRTVMQCRVYLSHPA